MTINVIPFDRPTIVAGFSVFHHFVYWLRHVRTSSKITTELLASHGLFPYEGGFPDSMISSRQLNSSICDWNHETSTIFLRYKFLCIESLSMDF